LFEIQDEQIQLAEILLQPLDIRQGIGTICVQMQDKGMQQRMSFL
jgi:hypothetical protein